MIVARALFAIDCRPRYFASTVYPGEFTMQRSSFPSSTRVAPRPFARRPRGLGLRRRGFGTARNAPRVHRRGRHGPYAGPRSAGVELPQRRRQSVSRGAPTQLAASRDARAERRRTRTARGLYRAPTRAVPRRSRRHVDRRRARLRVHAESGISAENRDRVLVDLHGGGFRGAGRRAPSSSRCRSRHSGASKS